MKAEKFQCVACSSTRFKQLFCADGTAGFRCAECGTLTCCEMPPVSLGPQESAVRIETIAALCGSFQVRLNGRAAKTAKTCRFSGPEGQKVN